MALSNRLLSIADLVTKRSVADVGTDHAYLPLYLLEQGRIDYAIASDIGEGPLSRAKEHIEDSPEKDRISLRLGSGLSVYSPGDAASLVIAGMGGMLMLSILEHDFDTAESFDEWVLQPQSDVASVRRYLYEKGRHIDAERFVTEGGKDYPMFRAVRGRKEMPSETELRYGPVLLAERNKTLYSYLIKQKQHTNDLLYALGRKESDKAAGRVLELEKESEMLREALNCYDS